MKDELSPEMLQCLMMVRYTLKRENFCVHFTPTRAMIEKFNYKMYDFKNNKVEEADSILMEEILLVEADNGDDIVV